MNRLRVAIDGTLEDLQGKTIRTAGHIQRPLLWLESVENRLHCGLDISLREDDCRGRKGHAPENPAVPRRFAFSLIKNDPLRKAGGKAARKAAHRDNDYLLTAFLKDGILEY